MSEAKPRTPKERREAFNAAAERRELINYTIKAAELAAHLLGTMSESSYATPLAHETGMAAYRILKAAIGDDLALMRMTEALCDMDAAPTPSQPEVTNE